MIGSAVRAIRWRALWPVAAGLVGCQAGHLLVYRLRFGAHAGAVQGAGVHAYFPQLATTTFAVAGMAVVAGLGVIGAARVAGGRCRGAAPARPPVIELVAALFTLQLALFALQEALESAASGAPLEPVVLLYGAACQLPVALLGAGALSLFLTRFEQAVERLGELAARPWTGLRPAERGEPAPLDVLGLAAQRLAGGLASRGPPPIVR